MSPNDLNTRLGVVALAGAAFLILYAIPQWVFSPSNVGNIVLAPTFWPYVLSGFLAIVGVGLVLTPTEEVAEETDQDDVKGSPWLRLLGLATIMALTLYALPRLGMVWSCMLALAATAFMFRTRYPKAALVCAALIPLVLYAFFTHVAGVALPQGDFVRLP